MTPDEILQLIDDYLDGTADEAAVAQLKSWLEADPSNIRLFAREVFLHQQLRVTLLADNSATCLAADSSGEGECGDNGAATSADTAASDQASKKPIVFPSLGMGLGGITSLPMVFFSLLFLAVAAWAAYQLGFRSGAANNSVVVRANASAESSPYVAKLVKLTNCQWDSTRTTADLNRGSQLTAGQSLHLLEGVAEINSTAHSGLIDKFRLEGPAGLMMGSGGVPSLLYGRLSVTSTIDSQPFVLDTPMGRVTVSEDASIGVAASASEVEMHVFFGSAAFEPLAHFRFNGAEERYSITSGSALKVASSSETDVVVENGVANEESFITPSSLNASRLSISPEYVAEIKSEKPLIYWRFDRVRGNRVLNEMGDDFPCRIEGPVRWRMYPGGNRSAEFGFSNQQGYLLSEDAIGDALEEQFTVEFWMKPSYFQRASMLSLVEYAEATADVPQQCVLVELYGQAADPGPVLRSRMRFLHRTPPSRDVNRGVSCYSSEMYAPRKWRHVAAVKDAASIKLFLDGTLVAEAKDTTETPSGLHVLVGQLYSFITGPDAGVRPFVGELAEVAVYNRALEVSRILNHIKLAEEEPQPRQSF